MVKPSGINDLIVGIEDSRENEVVGSMGAAVMS